MIGRSTGGGSDNSGSVPDFHLQHVGHQIAMQQHGGFGDAGGAAGILQEGDVVGADVGPCKRHFAAGSERIFERGRLWQVVGRHHALDVAHHAIDQRALHAPKHVAHACDDHVLDRRRRQRLLQDRREILQHDDGFGAGIVELEFQLARFVKRIDVHHREAGAQDRDGRHRILQHVRHHDGDTGAALKPGRLHPGGEGARDLIDLAVGQGLAHADESIAVAIRRKALLEHRDQRGEARHVDVGADARRIVPQPGPFHGISSSAAAPDRRQRTDISIS